MEEQEYKIICIDCGAERKVVKSCFRSTKRCKMCQKKIIRDKARIRYRKKKGIPLDAPITNIIKKNPQKKKKITVESELALAESESNKQKMSSEERLIRIAKMEKLLDLIPDKSTIDEW